MNLQLKKPSKSKIHTGKENNQRWGTGEREGGRRQPEGREGDEHTCAGRRWVGLELAPVLLDDGVRPILQREGKVEESVKRSHKEMWGGGNGGEEGGRGGRRRVRRDLPGRRSIWRVEDEVGRRVDGHLGVQALEGDELALEGGG